MSRDPIQILGVVAGLALSPLAAATPAAEAERLFTLEVKPLLSEKCFACHGLDPASGEEKFKGGLDLRSREALMRGGDTVADLIRPGDAGGSFLLDVVRWKDPDYEMPPKENDRLDAGQIASFEAWIEAGAPWPDEARQEEIRLAERERPVTAAGEIVATSGGLADEWTYRRYSPEDLWAWRELADPEVPELEAGPWAGTGHPIDAFVGRRLAQAGLEPAPRAAPEVLFRRLNFDLVGLPPTPRAMDEFLVAWEGDAEAAWLAAIERLLASPRYGERWAQHWLDVVRYADSAGYSNDWELSNAWRYRDYVIRSLNADKPWNRFIVEQLAGDELDPDDPELRVATGFLRVGPWEHTPMSPEVETRQLYLDEVVNATGQAFLSTAMSCVKCHDHKFDPIPTRDYYRMYSVFAATQPAEIPTEFVAAENRDGFERGREHVEELLAFAERERDRLEAKREEAARAWYAERGLPYKDFETRRPLKEEKPPRFVGLDSADQGTLKVRQQDVRIWRRALARFEPVAQAVYNGGNLHQKSETLRLPDPERKSDRERTRVIPASHVLLGGSVHSEGEPVTPGVLSATGVATGHGGPDDPFALPATMEGRRLAFARWVARDDNPLATRSIVNRVWHYHFGRGIAANPNNFGASGARPTHPGLLDHLTRRFLDKGWSLKALHRLILTSETWMMASDHPERERCGEVDPKNELRWCFEPRRLTAEELRDGILQVTGELNHELGGLPVFPEINREIAFGARKIQFSLAPAWQPSPTPEQRHRRTLYACRIRTLPDPLLEVFNRPNADESCELRDESSVTPQVFALLNGERMVNRSIALALRLEREESELDERIVRAFRLAFQRPPRARELDRFREHYREMVDYHRRHRPEPREYPEWITRSLVEELSGDAFEYREMLNGYRDFEPDPEPAGVPAETRALADLALLIFNANEFAFVY